jgi:hypothetical protein
MDASNFGHTIPQNPALLAWVEKIGELCQPDSIFW